MSSSLRFPIMVYYILIGTVILFSLLDFALAWAVVGRVNALNDYFYYRVNDGGGTIAVHVLLALIMGANLAFAVLDLVTVVRQPAKAEHGPLAVSHRKSIVLIALTAAIFVFMIVCGAVAGASGWIGLGEAQASVAFSVLTLVANAAWLVAVLLGVFGQDDAAVTTTAARDPEMSAPAAAPVAAPPAAVPTTATTTGATEDPHRE